MCRSLAGVRCIYQLIHLRYVRALSSASAHALRLESPRRTWLIDQQTPQRQLCRVSFGCSNCSYDGGSEAAAATAIPDAVLLLLLLLLLQIGTGSTISHTHPSAPNTAPPSHGASPLCDSLRARLHGIAKRYWESHAFSRKRLALDAATWFLAAVIRQPFFFNEDTSPLSRKRSRVDYAKKILPLLVVFLQLIGYQTVAALLRVRVSDSTRQFGSRLV